MKLRPFSSAVLAGLLGGMAFGQGSTSPGTTPQGSTQKAASPAIDSLTPMAGPAGTKVTISGTQLNDVTRVQFSPGREAPFKVLSDSQIEVTVPDGAVTGPIKLSTAAGTAVSKDTFEVMPR